MTLPSAKAILTELDTDGTLFRDDHSLMGRNIAWWKAIPQVASVDGHFTARQLMAIAVWMEEHSK